MGVTAGCDAVNPVGAFFIGAVCGIVMVLAIEFFDKVAMIDDPVGAISVHCVCGALGTLLVGLFATGSSTAPGLFYGGGFGLLGIQVLGVLSVALYVAVVITIVFQVIKHTIGLRADPEDELMGPGCFRARPAHRLRRLCHAPRHHSLGRGRRCRSCSGAW